jgi:hypothetical protein
MDSVRVRVRLVEDDFETRTHFDMEVDDFWDTLTWYSVALVGFSAAAVACAYVSPTMARILAFLPTLFMLALFWANERSSSKWLKRYCEDGSDASS